MPPRAGQEVGLSDAAHCAGGRSKRCAIHDPVIPSRYQTMTTKKKKEGKGKDLGDEEHRPPRKKNGKTLAAAFRIDPGSKFWEDVR